LWRRRWYAGAGRQRRLDRPVISVGNLSMGGRGKTPTTACLARLLLAAGERPSILSRGYARRTVEDGAVVVSDGRHVLADVERSGDEPLMLARDVAGAAVVVCEQRVLAGVLAERALGCTVHLLDDGFQHLELARDVDIVIVSGADLDDRPVPRGWLREPIAAVAAADAIVIDEPDETRVADARAAIARVSNRRVFTMHRTLGEPVPLEHGRGMPARREPVLAVAGIARPERFRRSLELAGWVVADVLAFRDHHWFTPADLARIAETASRAGASAVLTTTKDAMRLLVHRPLPMACAHVPLTVTIGGAGECDAWLADRLYEARA
jgi:tetraacyldisaccharide 4'-kinase